MHAPIARMVVKVKRRSGAKKKMDSPVGAPAAVRRRPPPAAATGPGPSRGGVNP